MARADAIEGRAEGRHSKEAEVAHERRRRLSRVSSPMSPMGSSLSSSPIALGLEESGVGVAAPLRRVMPEDRTGESDASSGGFEPRAEKAGQARVGKTRERSVIPVVGAPRLATPRAEQALDVPGEQALGAARVSRRHRVCFYDSRGCTAPRGIVPARRRPLTRTVAGGRYPGAPSVGGVLHVSGRFTQWTVQNEVNSMSKIVLQIPQLPLRGRGECLSRGSVR